MREFQVNLTYLFRRELDRLSDELKNYPNDDLLRKKSQGISNSAANLALHLIGNLNHFIGRQLGGTGYHRDRKAEFERNDIGKQELLEKLEECKKMVADVLQQLDDERLNEMHDPGFITEETMTIRQFLMHLYGHLNYHLGQINYHRRLLG